MVECLVKKDINGRNIKTRKCLKHMNMCIDNSLLPHTYPADALNLFSDADVMDLIIGGKRYKFYS